MRNAALENPGGAFGYPNSESTGSQARGPSANFPGAQRIFRNASTVQTIQVGHPVSLSTLSSRGEQVIRSVTANDPLFIGIAVTSAGLHTTRTTVAGTTGLGVTGTDFLRVQTEGVFHGALLSSAAVAGDQLVVSASTGTTASGTTAPGSLGVAPSTVGTAGYAGIAGVCLQPATTGTTGFLSTVGPRGIVLIRPSVCLLSSV